MSREFLRTAGVVLPYFMVVSAMFPEQPVQNAQTLSCNFSIGEVQVVQNGNRINIQSRVVVDCSSKPKDDGKQPSTNSFAAMPESTKVVTKGGLVKRV